MAQRLYLLRHGQTDANVYDIVQGQSLDLPLNDTGLKQAKLTADTLSKLNFDIIYMSPALRARQTAKKIFENHRPPVLGESNAGLAEINFGALEGNTSSENEKLYPNLLRIYREKPSQCVFPKGESVVEAYERIGRTISAIIANHPDNENILIVSHGIAITLIILYLFDLDIDKMFNSIRHHNCGFSIIDLKSFVWNMPVNKPKIICLNNTSHLNEEYAKRLNDRS